MRIRWAEHIVCMGKTRKAYNILVRQPEGRRPLGECRSRWDNNINMDLKEIGCGPGSSSSI
jgi:hypothetical protein